VSDSPTILVVDDHRDIRDLVGRYLQEHGLRVLLADGGDAMKRQLRQHSVDLVVLDIMMPGDDGLTLCRYLREHTELPVILLTAMSEETDRIVGLEMGADDYLTKPFSVAELSARVKALFRRVDAMSSSSGETSGPEELGELDTEGLRIDPARRRVFVWEQEVELTAREFDLLWHFASHPGRVFSRVQLLDKVWGYNHEGYEHTVNTHINRLRGKIEQDPARPEFIETVWGVGYRFRD